MIRAFLELRPSIVIIVSAAALVAALVAVATVAVVANHVLETLK